MAEELDPRQTADFKELLVSEMVQSVALVNVLERKGILTKNELLEEIERVNGQMIRAES